MPLDKIYDYVIVGSGPGGAALAKELADRTRTVLVIESGPRITSAGLVAGRRICPGKQGKSPETDARPSAFRCALGQPGRGDPVPAEEAGLAEPSNRLPWSRDVLHSESLAGTLWIVEENRVRIRK